MHLDNMLDLSLNLKCFNKIILRIFLREFYIQKLPKKNITGMAFFNKK
jgi:hypothetical protein